MVNLLSRSIGRNWPRVSTQSVAIGGSSSSTHRQWLEILTEGVTDSCEGGGKARRKTKMGIDWTMSRETGMRSCGPGVLAPRAAKTSSKPKSPTPSTGFERTVFPFLRCCAMGTHVLIQSSLGCLAAETRYSSSSTPGEYPGCRMWPCKFSAVHINSLVGKHPNPNPNALGFRHLVDGAARAARLRRLR